jgi:hypothetical protein
MRPYLRPAPPEGTPSALCPPGARAEAAGMWGGRPMEVVYQPAHHDVAFLRGAVPAAVTDGLRATGWEHWLSHGPDQMWVRDRVALTKRRALRDRSTPAVPRIA